MVNVTALHCETILRHNTQRTRNDDTIRL